MASKQFLFRKHANIGVADAMDDHVFLSRCFVDTGELSILRDVRNSKCIVVGRTGSGKTALVDRLCTEEERAIRISPDALSLEYVSNSGVIRLFVDLGVKLDLFYRLLWRHIFVVEVIKKHYNIANVASRDGFLSRIAEKINRSKGKQEALEYLRTWGDSFWEETDYRVKEITTKFEAELSNTLSATMGIDMPSIGKATAEAQANRAKRFTEEQKAELIKRGQEVVSQVQIRKLSDVITLLGNEILDDPQKHYFLTIDRLDEGWVDDHIRYQLIRALVETVRDINSSVDTLKIVIAVREDLLDRVFRFTRDSGFQEEKYRSLFLQLGWREEELVEVVDTRVQALVREQYTTAVVCLSDILPTALHVRGQPVNPTTYLVERTMYRPRDIILFFNECIRAAEGSATISQDNVFAAETAYAENRLRSLADEWQADYPHLIDIMRFLKGGRDRFSLRELAKDAFGNAMLDYLIKYDRETDYLSKTVGERLFQDDIDDLIRDVLKTLFIVGVIGIKTHGYDRVRWSYYHETISRSEIDNDSVIYVHPMFWRPLAIRLA